MAPWESGRCWCHGEREALPPPPPIILSLSLASFCFSPSLSISPFHSRDRELKISRIELSFLFPESDQSASVSESVSRCLRLNHFYPTGFLFFPKGTDIYLSRICQLFSPGLQSSEEPDVNKNHFPHDGTQSDEQTDAKNTLPNLQPKNPS